MAYQEIIAAADGVNADMIIMGTHGRTGVAHLFVGSTAERVVRQAPCPVMVVRERWNTIFFDPADQQTGLEAGKGWPFLILSWPDALNRSYAQSQPLISLTPGATLVTMTILCLFVSANQTLAQRQMENLGRGLVALRQTDGKVYVAGVYSRDDPDVVAFNLYRSADGGPLVKLNREPIEDSTNFIDPDAKTNQANVYFVRPMLKGRELPQRSFRAEPQPGRQALPFNPSANTIRLHAQRCVSRRPRRGRRV